MEHDGEVGVAVSKLRSCRQIHARITCARPRGRRRAAEGDGCFIIKRISETRRIAADGMLRSVVFHGIIVAGDGHLHVSLRDGERCGGGFLAPGDLRDVMARVRGRAGQSVAIGRHAARSGRWIISDRRRSRETGRRGIGIAAQRRRLRCSVISRARRSGQRQRDGGAVTAVRAAGGAGRRDLVGIRARAGDIGKGVQHGLAGGLVQPDGEARVTGEIRVTAFAGKAVGENAFAVCHRHADGSGVGQSVGGPCNNSDGLAAGHKDVVVRRGYGVVGIARDYRIAGNAEGAGTEIHAAAIGFGGIAGDAAAAHREGTAVGNGDAAAVGLGVIAGDAAAAHGEGAGAEVHAAAAAARLVVLELAAAHGKVTALEVHAAAIISNVTDDCAAVQLERAAVHR